MPPFSAACRINATTSAQCNSPATQGASRCCGRSAAATHRPFQIQAARCGGNTASLAAIMAPVRPVARSRLTNARWVGCIPARLSAISTRFRLTRRKNNMTIRAYEQLVSNASLRAQPDTTHIPVSATPGADHRHAAGARSAHSRAGSIRWVHHGCDCRTGRLACRTAPVDRRLDCASAPPPPLATFVRRGAKAGAVPAYVAAAGLVTVIGAHTNAIGERGSVAPALPVSHSNAAVPYDLGIQ